MTGDLLVRLDPENGIAVVTNPADNAVESYPVFPVRIDLRMFGSLAALGGWEFERKEDFLQELDEFESSIQGGFHQ
jgi:hypothetical protein